MSKKKSFSGSTMTLKDFHGGSIPSDLPLPSAPGVAVRPPDRPGAWGQGAAPRADHGYARARPGSAGAGVGARGRGLDDRAPLPFLPTVSAHIGRHFDEDERKPFDAAAAAASRRVPADPVRPAPPPSPPPQPARPTTSPSLGAHHAPVGSVGPAPGPWSARREEPAPVAAWSPGLAVGASRLAQACAAEKVASGRWQSRPLPPTEPDVEVIRCNDTENLDQRFGESIRIGNDGDRKMEKEKERNQLGVHSSVLRDQERVRSPVYSKAKERNAMEFYSDGPRMMCSEGRFGNSQSNDQAVVDASEQLKLNLLPRSKLLEPSETWAIEEKQVYQPPLEPVHLVNGHEAYGSVNVPKPGSAGADGGSRPAERPRLNLKPRSQPLEQSEESSERERKSLFGGARPRELVLKERGVDPASSLDVTVPTNRVKHDVPKTERKQEPVAVVTRHSERAENFLTEQRSTRDLEKKNYRSDLEKVDAQGSSWRSDRQKNTRESNKSLEPQHQEPDTWRKPVEEPKPETSGLRFGKAASALELAQAFSKSVSDDQRSMPGQPRVPFSRLTDTRDPYAGRPQRQINGY